MQNQIFRDATIQNPGTGRYRVLFADRVCAASFATAMEAQCHLDCLERGELQPVYPVTRPTINIGGSDGARLLEDHLIAVHAIRQAIAALESIAPHPRDHQALGQFPLAQREHRHRLQRLQSIIDELTEVAESIDAQMDERSRRHQSAS